MKHLHRLLILPVALLAFGCKGTDSKPVDSALDSDLSLASQAHASTPADSISAAERTRANFAASSRSPVAAAPVIEHRTIVHHVYESGSRGSSPYPAGTYTPAPRGPVDHVEKNTGRDAAIGAGAGAILGAATSKNKISGGLIGAAAGGILGAVIGNNVDKKKVPNH